MDPNLDHPLWDAIVGENWPGLGPSTWSALQTLAEAGATNLDVLEFARARRGFEDRVRSSAGLGPVRAAMRAEQARLTAVQEALRLAAELFGEFAVLLRRTCHRILDIVDEAGTRVHAVRTAESDDRPESERTAQIDGIVAGARAEVAQIVARAAELLGPNEFRQLARIEELLGRPGPWSTGPGHAPGRRGGGRDPRGERDATGGPDSPGHRGGTKPEVSPGTPGGDPSRGRPPEAPGLGAPRGEPDAAGPSGRAADDDQPKARGPAPGLDSVPPDQVAAPDGRRAGGGEAADRSFGAAQIDPHRQQDTRNAPSPAWPMVSGGDAAALADRSRNSYPADVAPPAGGAARDSAMGSDQVGPTRTAPFDSAAAAVGEHAVVAESSDPAIGSGPAGSSASPRSVPASEERSAPDDSLTTPGPPPVIAPAAAQSFVATGTPSLAQGSQGAAAQSVSPTRSVHAGLSPVRSLGDADLRAPNSGRPPAVGAPPGGGPGAVAPTVPSEGEKHGVRRSAGGPPAAVSDRGGAPRAHGDRGSGDDAGAGADRAPSAAAGEAFRHAVGAAMAAAAAPSFVVGATLDAELVLARTLLRGILAAVDDSPIAPAWAVSVLRHSGGLSAFVTSNEGCGWLPAGLYLPRTVSTPWVWEVARDAAWDGISDPARILAEFGRAWSGSAGAVPVALASSQPIDPTLRAALGNIACAGAVRSDSEPNVPAMTLSEPAPGLVDRLGLTAAPRLLERVAAVPERQVTARCIALARDAHARVARVCPPAPDLMGAPEIRDRILTALVRERPVPPQWWDELRDADDLLAASAVALRPDVSRVPLGELRSGRGGQLRALRAGYFQRRCDELLLLLAVPGDHRVLREAVYVHGLVADHPAISESPTTTVSSDST
ncbi:hypothetical protein ACWDOP_15050 [Nocardia sp. NPDC003693]